jgi:hypothetical protein
VRITAIAAMALSRLRGGKLPIELLASLLLALLLPEFLRTVRSGMDFFLRARINNEKASYIIQADATRFDLAPAGNLRSGFACRC